MPACMKLFLSLPPANGAKWILPNRENGYENQSPVLATSRKFACLLAYMCKNVINFVADFSATTQAMCTVE